MEPWSAWLIPWRVLVLLADAFAPWIAPLDAPLPPDPEGVLRRAFAGWFVLALLTAGLVHALRASRWRSRSAWLAAGVLACALGAAALLPRGTWPLGAAVLVVGPLAWAALLAGALGQASRALRVPLLVGWSVLLVASFGLASPRLRSREAMWRSVTRVAPAHARGWMAVAELARARRDDAGVRAALDHCVRAAPRAVGCLLARAEAELATQDAPGAARDAARVLALDEDHARAAVILALALARQSPLPAGALEAARRAVRRSPRHAEVRYALALTLDAAGRSDEARAEVRRAIELGAGGDALVLQAALALRAGDVALARHATEVALRERPEDPRALYDLGLIEQRAGHYNAAREAYLRALAADRRSYAARYNLALLAGSVGAREEARHHALTLLREHPGDVNAEALLRALQAAGPSPPAALRPLRVEPEP